MTTFSMNARRGASLAAIAIAAAGWTARADAAAFYLADQSTKGLGRAFSGETAERGAQQQWYNPAAIGGITGVQSYAGVTAILPGGSVRQSLDDPSTVSPSRLNPRTRTVSGSNGGDPVNNGYLPNGGIAAAIGDKFAVGLTVTSPFSFTTNYDSDFFGRYSADKSRLRTYDIQPSIAFSPNEHISIGGAVNVEYTRATLSNYLPDPFSTLGTPATPFADGHQYLKGDGWDVGYSFGFQYHDDKVDIGASYKSAIKHKLKGKLIVDGFTDPLIAASVNRTVDGAHASFTTPWQVSVGMRYHVTPALTLNAQVTRFGWEKFDGVYLSNLGALANQEIVENYKNSYTYAVGADYKLSDRTTLRAGVSRDLTPIRDGFRDPRVPDGNRWFFAVGGSHELNDRMGVDFGAAYDKIESATVNDTSTLYGGTLLQTTTTTNGRTHNGHAVLLSLGAHLAI